MPQRAPTPVPVVLARIVAKTDIRGLTSCWVWKGAKAGGNRSWDRFGPYPRIQVDCQHRYVHGLILELLGRPKPSPEHVPHHHCRRRLCINPRHLEWVTGERNSQLATECRGTEPPEWDEPVF